MEKFQRRFLILMILYLQTKASSCSQAGQNHSNLMSVIGVRGPKHNFTVSGFSNSPSSERGSTEETMETQTDAIIPEKGTPEEPVDSKATLSSPESMDHDETSPVTSSVPVHHSSMLERVPNVSTSPTEDIFEETEATEPSVESTNSPDLTQLDNPMYHVITDGNCSTRFLRSDLSSSVAACPSPEMFQSIADHGSFKSLSLTTEDMEQCQPPYNVSMEAKSILNGSITVSSNDSLSAKTLCIPLYSPPSTIIEIRVGNVAEWMTNNKFLGIQFSLRHQDRKVLKDLAQNRVLQSSTRDAMLLIEGLTKTLFDPAIYRTFTLTIHTVPWCTKEQLEVKCLKENKQGLIQTPHWNGQTKYSPYMNSCLTITAPAYSQYIMTSFIQMDLEDTKDCHFDFLEIYLTSSCAGVHVSRICDSIEALPAVYHTNVMSLRVKTDSNLENSGFRLIYSFHSAENRPTQMWSGRWVCSGANGSILVQHFICSAQRFCVNAEDRISGCPPADLCGGYSFQFDGRCYRYIKPNRKIKWTEATWMCNYNKGYLVSLNTEDEWKRVAEFWANFSNTKEYLMVGLRQNIRKKDLYSSMLQWDDKTVAYYLNISHTSSAYPPYCAGFRLKQLTYISCYSYLPAHFLCEIELESSSQTPTISLPVPSITVSSLPGMTDCRDQSSTYSFLKCNRKSHCYGSEEDETDECLHENSFVADTMFTCRNEDQVHYSLVCDHRHDCGDRSDESFCQFPPCPPDHFFCKNSKECIPQEERCDGIRHCVDGKDESLCHISRKISEWDTAAPPAVIDFTAPGSITVRAVNTSHSDPACPETHFQCPGDGYCLPVYVRCNGVFDCPGKEDEADCDSYTCPGFYRCLGAKNCLHANHLCDGQFQCPRHDDELMCDFRCPVSACNCVGFAFRCRRSFSVYLYPQLRYLYADDTGMDLQDVANNHLLIFLSLKRCGIKEISVVNLSNVQVLDLAYNDLQVIRHEEIKSMKNLRRLSLAFNQMLSLHAIDFSSMTFPNLYFLDMSGGSTYEITNTSFLPFPNIQHLNLSRNRIQKVWEPGFSALHKLTILDLSECPVTEFDGEMFKGLSRLQTIYASKFKMCCPTVLPETFDIDQCHAPSDEVSSCEALLRTDTFRVFLVMYALFSLLGNFVSFMYRVFGKGVTKALGFDIFVTHLCVADFLMGVYLAIVGVADRIYYGTYEWNDSQWKRSVACQTAGFLSLVSSEVSAFLICFITLERFVLIRFPHKDLRFTPMSARTACLIGWTVGVLLAAIPLLPFSPAWEFYGQTGICIPLPITRKVFPGSEYAFAVMIVFNLILFLLIAAGQFLIFWSLRSQTKTVSSSSKKAKDMAIARRLLAVVMSDFLCWFPIGLLGLLARTGTPISGNINVAMAIFVLPFNSALNPFLYTFHTLLERHRMARARRQCEEKSEASRNCPTCARRKEDLSRNNTSVMTTGYQDHNTITKVTDEEVLVLTEAFLKEHLMTPEYFHLRDHVVQMIRRRSYSISSGQN